MEIIAKEFKPGELFIYVNGDRYEVGKVKKENYTGDGYFCWYNTGETAANTPVDCMHKITNLYALNNLGGSEGKALRLR
jgi:hypothetical protein